MNEAVIIAVLLAFAAVIALLSGWCSNLEQRVTKLEKEREKERKHSYDTHYEYQASTYHRPLLGIRQDRRTHVLRDDDAD